MNLSLLVRPAATPLALILLGLLWSVVGSVRLAMDGDALFRQWLSRSFTPTPAIVEEARVATRRTSGRASRTIYYPTVVFRYEVDGTTRRGVRIRFQIHQLEGATVAAQVVRELRESPSTTAFVNPRNRDEAVLYAGLADGDFVPLFLSMPLAMIGFAMIAWGWKRRRSSSMGAECIAGHPVRMEGTHSKLSFDRGSAAATFVIVASIGIVAAFPLVVWTTKGRPGNVLSVLWMMASIGVGLALALRRFAAMRRGDFDLVVDFSARTIRLPKGIAGRPLTVEFDKVGRLVIRSRTSWLAKKDRLVWQVFLEADAFGAPAREYLLDEMWESEEARGLVAWLKGAMERPEPVDRPRAAELPSPAR